MREKYLEQETMNRNIIKERKMSSLVTISPTSVFFFGTIHSLKNQNITFWDSEDFPTRHVSRSIWVSFFDTILFLKNKNIVFWDPEDIFLLNMSHDQYECVFLPNALFEKSKHSLLKLIRLFPSRYFPRTINDDNFYSHWRRQVCLSE